MNKKKNILAIIGSASINSINKKLVEKFAALTSADFHVTIYDDLKNLPHFDPALSTGNTPKVVLDLREAVDVADGVLICTPEYIFSIPSGLKNAVEWLVSTTVFSGKPTGLITASTMGQKGHEELQLIMKTLMANFTEEAVLWIQGVKGKFTAEGEFLHDKTQEDFMNFVKSYKILVDKGTG